jgi:L-lactate dehydrogenase complex protein LldG
MTDARTRILERISNAIAARDRTPHPGPFEGKRRSPSALDAVEQFVAVFTGSGGEVVRAASPGAAHAWLEAFAGERGSVSVGTGVPSALAPASPTVEAAEAALGVSMARAAVAETGSVILDARDGRLTQLLPPTHLVVLGAGEVYVSLREALEHLARDLPSALALHSGPSKSADIGQVLVQGVHGPGRVVVLLIDETDAEPQPHR